MARIEPVRRQCVAWQSETVENESVIRWMSGRVEVSFMMTGLLNVFRFCSLLVVNFMLSLFNFSIASEPSRSTSHNYSN